MKKYEIVAAEEIVAEVRMDYDRFSSSFNVTQKAIEFIIKERPELKDCSNRWNIRGEVIIFTFCSTGNPVMQEIQ